MCQSHTGRLTGLWFLSKPAFGLNTNDDESLLMPLFGQGNRHTYDVQTWQDIVFRGFHNKTLYEFLFSLICLAPCSLFHFASPANYHGTYINHHVSQYSVSLSPELLANRMPVLQALLLSADQNALVKRLVIRNPTTRQTWHL